MPEGEAVVVAHSVPTDSVVLRMSVTGQVSPCSRAAVCGARHAYQVGPSDGAALGRLDAVHVGSRSDRPLGRPRPVGVRLPGLLLAVVLSACAIPMP